MDPMALLGSLGLGVALLIVVVAILLGAALLLLAMKIVSVEGRSYLKALGVVVVAFIANLVVGFLLGMVLGAGLLAGLLNLVISLLITGWLVSLFCKSSFGKGVGAAALYWLFFIILGVLVSILFGGMLVATG